MDYKMKWDKLKKIIIARQEMFAKNKEKEDLIISGEDRIILQCMEDLEREVVENDKRLQSIE